MLIMSTSSLIKFWWMLYSTFVVVTYACSILFKTWPANHVSCRAGEIGRFLCVCGCASRYLFWNIRRCSLHTPWKRGQQKIGWLLAAFAVATSRGIPRKFPGDCPDRYNIYYIYRLNKNLPRRASPRLGASPASANPPSRDDAPLP